MVVLNLYDRTQADPAPRGTFKPKSDRTPTKCHNSIVNTPIQPLCHRGFLHRQVLVIWSHAQAQRLHKLISLTLETPPVSHRRILRLRLCMLRPKDRRRKLIHLHCHRTLNAVCRVLDSLCHLQTRHTIVATAVISSNLPADSWYTPSMKGSGTSLLE